MRSKWIHICLCFVLCLSKQFTFSQEYNQYSFNELYGFKNNTIYDIKQSEDGSFWIGTSQGLVHFDGSEFETYASSVYDKDASNLSIDEQGKVWFSNFGGQLFYLDNDSIHVAIESTYDGNFIREYVLTTSNIVLYISQHGEKLIKHFIGSHSEEVVFYKENEHSQCFGLWRDQNEIELFVAGKEELSNGRINYLEKHLINLEDDTTVLLSKIHVPNGSAKLGSFKHRGVGYAYLGLSDSIHILEFTGVL